MSGSLELLSTLSDRVELDQNFLSTVFDPENSTFSWLINTLWIAIGIIAKTFWDRLVERQEELARLRRDKKLEILEKQLSEFYWPIYLRLEKDNLIWKKVFSQDHHLSPDIRRRLESDFILPNHGEIIDILENKIYLARAPQALTDQIFQYIRHVAIYKAIREAGILDKDPMDLDEPFPSDLTRLISEEKHALQAEYDRLLDLAKEPTRPQRRFRLSR